MQTFNEIIQSPELNILSNLKGKEFYYAHLKKNLKDYETIEKHTNLVIEYFCRQVSNQDIEYIIDNIIKKIIIKSFKENHIDLANFIKASFLGTVYFHDFGKINPNFQREKMNNKIFSQDNFGIGSDHSLLSTYLYLSYFYNKVNQSNFNDVHKSFLYTILTILSHVITKHHTQLNNALELEINEVLINKIEIFYNKFNNVFFINKDYLLNLLRNNDLYTDKLNELDSEIEIFLLVKLNSSLLTSSDYLATNEFMLNISSDKLGVLDTKLKNKIISNIRSIKYNKQMFDNFDFILKKNEEELREINKCNLNFLRQKLSADVISEFRKNENKKLFYIEAPTGSGKTNLSLLLISELLEKREKIKKIFYVFPFTALITQNYIDIKKDLHLSNDEIVQIHAKASFNNSNKSDDEYGDEHKNFIDTLFLNFPFIMLSHIRFFDIIISTEKDKNYLLSSLANSIVIIDELQSYTPTEWDKINYLIQKYSDLMNITFVLMSATLPKISILLIEKEENSTDQFYYLVKNKNLYYQNPNFNKRAEYDFSLILDKNFSFSNENLSNIVFNNSEKYFSENNQVATLVEFITKNDAKSFYDYVKEKTEFASYNKLFINSTILEPRRLEIINEIKSKKSVNNKLILIATQVIEAGLNIDFDIGFKDMSIADSEEQFAGRINRNASKKGSKIFLFNTSNARFTYKYDLRYLQQKNISFDKYAEILYTKNFDSYYDLVLSNINKFNKNIFAENLNTFIDRIRLLNYHDVKRFFTLIKDNTISIFVPIDLDKEYFTDDEINFLNNYNINTKSISGEKVWGLYSELILNKNLSFIEKSIKLNILSSIMSKFIFNSWLNNNQYNQLRHYGEYIYGYFYLKNWKEIYSYCDGLKLDLETDCNFL